MILSATSFELGEGPVRARGFLINMNWVFEEFVRAALREALHEPASRFGTWRELYYGGKVQRLYFDEDYRKELEPDLLWAPDGTLRFVGDAKYKRIFADNMPNADLYQMLAYIVAANLPSGLLIYPKDEAEETTLRVAKLGRTIETRTLDISAEPKDIRESVARIAERIRSMGKCSINRER
jgi:5-methylcytosine-specific restriction enzyme subunit McrC